MHRRQTPEPGSPAAATLRHWALPALSVGTALAVSIPIALLMRQLDFATYLMGGRDAFSPGLYGAVDPVIHLGFTYPPFATLPFAALRFLPERAGQVLMTLTNLTALAALVGVTLHVARPDFDRRRILWWSLTLLGPAALFDATRETIYLGQVNILIVTACIADMTVALRVPGTRRHLPRGVLIGLAAAVKLTPLIFIPLLALTRQVRAAGRAAITFTSAAALATVLNPHASAAYWLHDVFETKRAGSLLWVGNQSLAAVYLRFAHQSVLPLSVLGASALVATAGVVVGALVHLRRSALAGVLVCWAAESLASPVSWSHHMVWTVPLALWLAIGVDRPRRGRVLAALVTLLYVAAPIWWTPYGAGKELHEHAATLGVANSFAFASFAILCAPAFALLRDALRRRAPQPGAERAMTRAAIGTARRVPSA